MLWQAYKQTRVTALSLSVRVWRRAWWRSHSKKEGRHRRRQQCEIT